ncbi:hypothetical protein GCM10017556_03460 [Micromonospora sagamiensis]|nr:hypothetical protein GCM10017556_03460 [Micromonospora sagamiensis]
MDLPVRRAATVQFRRLVQLVAERGGDVIADGRPGRQWSLDIADWMLQVAAYWRTDLTMRQIGPARPCVEVGYSHSLIAAMCTVAS